MNKTILVTGAHGFLGRHTARYFKSHGYSVYALGHGVWAEREQCLWGIDHWLTGDIILENLMFFEIKFDVIVHCAGSGSVAYSMQEPMKDFQRSVQSTLAILEYMRRYNANAKLIYPSSPAVQGVHENSPIKEEDLCHPVSPYGVHKKIAEDLCLSYKKYFELNVSIIRLFSIYGDFLKKQLLWDAANKFIENSPEAIFWGGGDETRDWLHVDDAVSLMIKLVELTNMPEILNVGNGVSYTISETLDVLRNYLGVKTPIVFNSQVKEGDPKYYWADIKKAKSIGWKPQISFEYGIKRYADWFKRQL